MCDDWLPRTHQTWEQYTQNIVLKGSPSDALFAMLVVMELEINVMIATIQGLWSTKQDMQPTTDDDIFLVFTDSGLCQLLFLVEPQCVKVCLQTPCPDWSTVPPILNALVLMVFQVVEQFHYTPKKDQSPVPLLQLLCELAGRSPEDYRRTLVQWIEQNCMYPPVSNWFWDFDMDWLTYWECLLSLEQADGFELMLATNALRFHLNLIQHDHFWSLRREGPK